MRKSAVSALMMILLLLAGCGERGSGPQKQFESFRLAVKEAGRIETELTLCCDSGEVVSEYGLAVTSEDGACRVTVTAPELIAGVSAVVTAGGESVEYADVLLSVGTQAGLTPVTAAPAMLNTMAYGYAEMFWREDGYAVTRLMLNDEAVLTLWLDDGAPLCAEIASDGRTIMTCRFESWALTLGGTE